MNNIFGKVGFNFTTVGLFFINNKILSIEIFAICAKSILTSPLRSFIEDIDNFLHKILISAKANKL